MHWGRQRDWRKKPHSTDFSASTIYGSGQRLWLRWSWSLIATFFTERVAFLRAITRTWKDVELAGKMQVTVTRAKILSPVPQRHTVKKCKSSVAKTAAVKSTFDWRACTILGFSCKWVPRSCFWRLQFTPEGINTKEISGVSQISQRLLNFFQWKRLKYFPRDSESEEPSNFERPQDVL
jgi:hypothetical protein